MNKEEFRQLQQTWYTTLTELGFKDIERIKGDHLILTESRGSYSYRKTGDFEREMQEEYFRCMSQAARDEETKYRNNVDKYVMIRHVEGAKIEEICDELGDRGIFRDRSTIRIIIRRYEMAWGFKIYTRRQLKRKNG